MSEATEIINIPALMANLLELHQSGKDGGPSKLEIALGRDGAKNALQAAAAALKKHLNPSILPWRHDIADAQRMARQVMVDMAASAESESTRICNQ